jgi:hypothetical protein
VLLDPGRLRHLSIAVDLEADWTCRVRIGDQTMVIGPIGNNLS